MRFSIRTRLAFAFSLIFVALLILFSGCVYYLMSSNLERELREDSEHDMQQVVDEFKTLPWEKALTEMREEAEEFQLAIQVIDDKGKSVHRTDSVKEWDWPVDHELLEKTRQKAIWSDIHLGGISHLVLTRSFMPPGKPLHFLQIANSRADLNRIRSRLIYCINIGTPLILIVAVLAGRLFSKKALEPVERIRERAQAIKSDNLQDRLVYDGPPDELYRLTETLNDLLGRVQSTLDQMKRFIADASHELRIPLTGIRGTLEVALRQDRTKEEYRQTIEKAYAESERLSELVWDLLSLARADAGEMKLNKREVDLEPFIKNVFEEAKILNTEPRVHMRLGEIPKGRAVFDETKIHQLLINILENAIKYNKPGGWIYLSTELRSSCLVIVINDAGIGILPDDQSKIFDRFYRVDKARSREAGGTGLGLSIARAIAEAHKGTLSVQSVSGEGSAFTITLPLS